MDTAFAALISAFFTRRIKLKPDSGELQLVQATDRVCAKNHYAEAFNV